MKVSSFFLGDSITSHDGGKTPSLQNPRYMLRPTKLPSMLSFAFIASVTGIESEKEYVIRFEIRSPQGTLLQESSTASIPPSKKETILPLQHQGITLCAQFQNLTVEESGDYNIHFYMNDIFLDEITVPIYKEGSYDWKQPQ